MPLKKLQDFLDQRQVKYVTIRHSPAFTAQEIAASAHVSGKELAKTVMIKLDGRLHMAVLPASSKVDFEQFRRACDARHVELADENEFRGIFPDCELGAMPPFGNLFGMQVFMAEELTEDDEICFNAGTHTELVRMPLRDFIAAVEPRVLRFAVDYQTA